ncbi:MAG: carboxypeptidase-like regulatory domain-containing protein [bacterium]
MKYIILLLISCISAFQTYSQIYSGQLIDVESGLTIQYANIGIVGKNVGTVSDNNGLFTIELSNNFNNDSLCISCIGYEKKTFLIRDLKNSISDLEQFRIELKSKIYQFDEIVVRPINTKVYTLGNFCEPDSPYGNSFPSKNLGTEIGVMIKLPEEVDKAYLKKLRYFVGEFTYDYFTVRLNVYNINNGLPDKNILKEQIFIDITSTGEYIINLQRNNIVITEDFFISLEYFKIPDQKEEKLIFCAVHNSDIYGGNGYYRLTSQGKWNREYGDNLGFSVEVNCKQ